MRRESRVVLSWVITRTRGVGLLVFLEIILQAFWIFKLSRDALVRMSSTEVSNGTSRITRENEGSFSSVVVLGFVSIGWMVIRFELVHIRMCFEKVSGSGEDVMSRAVWLRFTTRVFRERMFRVVIRSSYRDFWVANEVGMLRIVYLYVMSDSEGWVVELEVVEGAGEVGVTACGADSPDWLDGSDGCLLLALVDRMLLASILESNYETP